MLEKKNGIKTKDLLGCTFKRQVPLKLLLLKPRQTSVYYNVNEDHNKSASKFSALSSILFSRDSVNANFSCSNLRLFKATSIFLYTVAIFL